MRDNVASPHWIRETILRSYGDCPASPGEMNYIERHQARYARTLRFLPAEPGSLLDVGCFPGHTSILATARGWSVKGVSRIDGVFVTEEFVTRMKRSGVPVFHADVERDAFPFAEASFDCVFFNETVEHLPFNPFHALDQIWRVLKPGGRLVFSVPNLASFDHIWALLRGRSLYPEVSRPMEDAYHADIGQRHIREYTPRECEYLLARQDKYLYRFDLAKRVMDRSWDGVFYTEKGRQPGFARLRPGAVIRALVTRVSRRYRSNIIIVASKPRECCRIRAPDIGVEGFYPEELSGTSPSFVRNPLYARWMGPSAELRLRIPEGVGAIDRIEALVWMPAPASAGSLRVVPEAGGVACDPLCVSPSSEPRRCCIRPAVPLARREPRWDLAIRFRSTTWTPCAVGVPGDARILGPMMSPREIAVEAHPRGGPAAAARRCG